MSDGSTVGTATRGDESLSALGALMTAEFASVLRAVLNDVPRAVPVVFDNAPELESIARALEVVNASGGFEVSAVVDWHVEAQVRVPRAHAGIARSRRSRDLESELLERAAQALPSARVDVAPPADVGLLMALHTVVPNAAGLEDALHRAAHAVAPAIAGLGAMRPSILLRAVPARRVRARCSLSRRRLLAAAGRASDEGSEHALARAVAALGAGAREPSVAKAHNAMIESGIAAVALALGNAPAQVIAASRRHAARSHACLPLCTWRLETGALEGEIELPLDISPFGRARGFGTLDAQAEPLDAAMQDIGLLAVAIGMAASVVALTDALRVRLADVRRTRPPPRKQRRAA